VLTVTGLHEFFGLADADGMRGAEATQATGA
jgi:hypothetical protein